MRECTHTLTDEIHDLCVTLEDKWQSFQFALLVTNNVVRNQAVVVGHESCNYRKKKKSELDAAYSGVSLREEILFI